MFISLQEINNILVVVRKGVDKRVRESTQVNEIGNKVKKKLIPLWWDGDGLQQRW